MIQSFLQSGSGKKIVGEEYTTTKRSINSLTPVWNEKFNFGCIFDLAIDPQNLPTLCINVFHVKNVSSKQPMGSIEIPLESLTQGMI